MLVMKREEMIKAEGAGFRFLEGGHGDVPVVAPWCIHTVSRDNERQQKRWYSEDEERSQSTAKWTTLVLLRLPFRGGYSGYLTLRLIGNRRSQQGCVRDG